MDWQKGIPGDSKMITIALDAGHNETDSGAVSKGLYESYLTGDIVNRIAYRMDGYDNCKILCVPRFTSLAARAAYANDQMADLFLSIHINAGGGTGFESYIWSFDYLDSTLADEYQMSIHSTIMGFLAPYGVKDRGMKARNFDVLRLTNMPAVLLENLFIDNPWDAEKLVDLEFRDKLSNEIAYALVRLFDLKRVDPCSNCKRVNDLIIERGQLFADYNRQRQVMRRANDLLAGELIK